METLDLHEFHQTLSATFAEVNGVELVLHYGEPLAEHKALRETAGVADLSCRGRVCLTGADRLRFLNGQVTNNIKILQPGQGVYAALVTAKGKMVSDLHVHCLKDEVLLDFEPGLTETVIARLQDYVVADDVEVVNVAPQYGLLTVQGPMAAEVLEPLELSVSAPKSQYESSTLNDGRIGEWVIVALPRLETRGYDLFVPTAALGMMMERLIAAAEDVGGRACGWEAMEITRIEAGIPRFGQDVDESHIPIEAGLEKRAIRYDKGCYIGQEVINRIHSIGGVTRSLRGLLLPDDLATLPSPGDRLLHADKQVGYVTSVLRSPAFGRNLAMGYVRKEVNQPGAIVTIAARSGNHPAQVVALPFSLPSR